MHGVYIRALVLSFVLVSGMFILSVGVEGVFAEKGGNDKQVAKGCVNANNEKVKEKNKHCDGINGEPLAICDTDGNNLISFTELLAFINGAYDQVLLFALFTSADVFPDGAIDTSELAGLNTLLDDAGLDLC